LKIIKISDSVRVYQDSSYYLVNSICINLGSELLFIDTGLTTEVAKKFREEMHNTFKIKKAILVITHADGDHYMGLEPFFDIPIFVTEKFMAPFKESVESFNLKALESFQPTEMFSTEKSFGLEGREVIFELVGGHTNDSCYGYFPAEKILIAGDNLLSDMPQYLLHDDADLYKTIRCLKKWTEMDISTIIPGHGNPVKREYIDPVLGYYEELYEVLVQAKNKGLTIEEVLNHRDLPEYFIADPEEWIVEGIKCVYENISLNLSNDSKIGLSP
jgi:glyoxylase-like metal-dependent hydrolase (beta-lactamase superfamily II)